MADFDILAMGRRQIADAKIERHVDRLRKSLEDLVDIPVDAIEIKEVNLDSRVYPRMELHVRVEPFVFVNTIGSSIRVVVPCERCGSLDTYMGNNSWRIGKGSSIDSVKSSCGELRFLAKGSKIPSSALLAMQTKSKGVKE